MRSAGREASPWFLMLFGLPFMAVGVFMGWLTYDAARQWQDMKAWEETRARVLAVSLETHYSTDSEGHRSTTYSVSARYQYVYRGKGYTGTRISIEGGSDNVGSYHQDMAARLQEAQRTEQKVPCYVNPANPEEAVLDRSLRTSLVVFKAIFVVAFGGAGTGVSLYGFRQWRKRRRDELSCREKGADAPWLRRADWRAGVIRSGSRGAAFGLLFFAAIWDAMSFPIAWLVLSDLFPDGWHWPEGNEWRGELFVLLFPAIGIILLVVALRALARNWRNGVARFRMMPVPGVLGGIVGGVVEIPRKLAPEDEVRLELSCVLTICSGENTSTRVDWSHENGPVRDLTPEDPQQTVLPVLFSPPYVAMESGEALGDGVADWVLKVSAPDAGLDESFDIPVFRTSASREDFVLDPQAVAGTGTAPAGASQEDYAREGIYVEERPDGVRMVFPRLRHPGLLLGQVLIDGALWTGAVLLWLHALLIFALACGFFALLFLLPVLQQLFEYRELQTGADGLTLVGSRWGGAAQTVLEWSEVDLLKVEEDQNFFGGRYWRVDLLRAAGGKHTVVSTLRLRRVAQTIAARLQQARDAGTDTTMQHEPQ